MTGAPQDVARPARPLALVPFAAKLAPPVADGRLIARPRLVDELVAFRGRQVVLTAPAGYGKSTLAAQWIAADLRPAAWLTLDAVDNDPFVLLTYLGLALDAIEPLAPGTLELLTQADAELDDVLVGLATALTTRTQPFVLVLDDVHVLSGPSRDAVLSVVASSVPTGSTLVLTTRDTAPFPTSRAALRGDVTVVDGDRLAMTVDEAADLLRSGGIDTDAETTAAIRDLTEGWPAGLYMAALALRDADDPGASARALSGRHRRIADFFAEEVLPALEPEDLDFLLSTAVLDRCCGELCDAALERTGSGGVLERLARGNRFVIALDDTGDWYRYHHLFADMLLAEQRARDPAAVAAVALRASEWWEARFEPDHAVVLALAAPDRTRAIDVIARFAPILQTTRRLPTVDRWLAAFTDDEITRSPALAVTAAWNALLAGDVHGVHRFASAVAASTDDALLPDGTPPNAAVALLRALTTSRGLTDVRDDAATAFAEHLHGSPYRGIAALLEGGARLMLGDWEGAREPVDATVTLGRAGFQPVLAQGLAGRARAEAIDGDWAAARASVEEALDIVDAYWMDERPAMALVFAIAALAHARAGLVTRADEERAHCLRLVGRLEDVTPFHATASLIELAEAALLTDHVDDANALLAEAERRLRRLRDTGLLPFALERVAARAAERTANPVADLAEPLSPAELRVLAWLPTHLSFGEIGEELFVSRNTVKSHAMAIYRKLGVTSRSAAVKEAAELGLLPA